MRTFHLLTVGLSCFLAGTATFQAQGRGQQQNSNQGPVRPNLGETPESITAKDDPFYRLDCDDWASFLPTETSVWDKLVAANMTLEDAISLAVEYAKEERGYPLVRVQSAQFVAGDKPFFEVMLLTWNENKDKAQRWQAYVGIKTRQVKRWLLQERFPGTPIRGELIELPSGLMMHDVREGDGAEITPQSTVQVNYVGSILDGTIVIDTYEARTPDTFPMSKAPVKGMAEGLVGARAGGKRKLILPPDLAYGDQGFAGMVPPGAAVIFDVEILRVD